MKIAITGNMASGKSTFVALLKEKGFFVLDCDALAKSVYDAKSPYYMQIVSILKKFDLYKENHILFEKLRKVYFKNQTLKQSLEAIIYPFIKKTIEQESQNHPLFFAEVPLLYESKMESLFDCVVLIHCEQDALLQRNQVIRQISKEDTLERLNYQIPSERLLEKANIVIHNNKTFEAFYNECQRVIEKLVKYE